MGKPTIWVTTRSITNRAVQSQKRARSFKFLLEEEEGLYYHVAKTKALISFVVTTKLVCAFVIGYVDCLFSYIAAHCLPLLSKDKS